jgi:hypothetical protein
MFSLQVGEGGIWTIEAKKEKTLRPRQKKERKFLKSTCGNHLG